MAPILGLVKNPIITMALAQANDNKHMINLNGMMSFSYWIKEPIIPLHW